jgi:N-acetylneuraminate lyase
MITRKNLKGIWAGVPTAFRRDESFDEETFVKDVIKCCELGIDGVYTTGGTGEFYALEFDEFKRMVDAFARATEGRKIMTQVGCTWINTQNVIERARYVQSKGIMGVQVALPFWHPLNDTEVLQFFKDVSEACPDLAIIHYRSSRERNSLQGRHYRKLINEVPNLVGTKFMSSDFYEWMELMSEAPELCHFVGDDCFLVHAMMIGAKGSYSSIIYMIPNLILKLYNHCVKRELDEAIAIEKRIFKVIAATQVYERHAANAVGDKAITEASGFLETKRYTRKPYLPLDEEEFTQLKEVLKGFPEFG